jgi:hypothetical protein
MDSCKGLFLTNKLQQNIITLLKKISDFPVPSRDVTNQTLPGRECDIRAGDRKIVNLVYSAVPNISQEKHVDLVM